MLKRDDIEDMGYGYYDNTYTKFDYSKWVEDKIITEGTERLMENTLGLMGEAGEVAEKIKKMIRDGNRFTPEDIVKELGDVVFYATALANYYGSSLSGMLAMNIDKLDSREKRGVIKGEGDNR
jgi:NTP pyrophosphatase (non-canonical NTP hydrolase)